MTKHRLSASRASLVVWILFLFNLNLFFNLNSCFGGSEGWAHSTAAAPLIENEGHEIHERAERLASWARNKSSDVQLTGAHVPLTPEEIAVIQSQKESHHRPVPLATQAIITPEKQVFLDPTT